MSYTMDLMNSRTEYSFSFKARLGLWRIVQVLFYPRYFRFLSPVRVCLLRLFGAEIGYKCLFCGGTTIRLPWEFRCGNYVVLAEKSEIYNFSKVSLGDSIVISQNSIICTGSHDYSVPYFPLTTSPVVIHSNSWIASRAFVCPGVTIGEGAVIGACSVVTKDIPEWTVCAGHPCKPLKKRVMAT